jgi:cell division protein FtsN
MIPKAFSGCTKNLFPRNSIKLQTDWEPLEIDRKQPHPMANNSKGKKTTISLTPDPKELTIEDQHKQKHQPLQTTSSTANPQSLPTTLHKDGSSSHHKTTIT